MAVVKLGKPVRSNLGGPNGAMAYIIDPAKTTRTHPKASKRTAVWRTTSS